MLKKYFWAKSLVLFILLFSFFSLNAAPLISQSDDTLLTLVQKQTYRYFYEYAHPNSGMALERTNQTYDEYDPLNTITTGGSGFGFMATIVAVERQFISRKEGVEHLLKAVTFLDTKADKFNGLFSHWMNGKTGKTFANWYLDNGADIVETAFLFQGLLTVRQYFSSDNAQEVQLRNLIDKLWKNANWNWHTNNTNTDFYWHWSPTYGWQMNHKIRGWDETLITYVMAASSPTFPINKDVYDNCFKNSNSYINGKEYYGIKLPLGFDYGGPLFFAHYSFLGLDPRNLTDGITNYFEQNVAHTKINHAYVVDNPKKFVGYNDSCWGLTASDNDNGYAAHSPTDDRGVLTPTAALSSFPYTPELSMKALKCFIAKSELWSDVGFKDAFNPTTNWVAEASIAIDQGPIIIMIENYRTQLLWNLFMSHPDIQKGLKKLGFSSPHITKNNKNK